MLEHRKRLLLRRTAVCLGVIGAVAASFALPAAAQWEADNQLFHNGSSHQGSDFVMIFPQVARATYFYSSFGESRSGGRRHQGNDLMAPKMAPIYAASAGVVTELGKSRRAGYYIIIDHGGGWSTWYVHLNNDTPGTDDGNATPDQTYGPGIQEGVQVAAGQVIGYVGDSGNAEGTGPHTHFELHRNGRPINPYRYLAAAYARAKTVASIEAMLQMTDMFNSRLETALESSSPAREAILSLLLPRATVTVSRARGGGGVMSVTGRVVGDR